VRFVKKARQTQILR